MKIFRILVASATLLNASAAHAYAAPAMRLAPPPAMRHASPDEKLPLQCLQGKKLSWTVTCPFSVSYEGEVEATYSSPWPYHYMVTDCPKMWKHQHDQDGFDFVLGLTNLQISSLRWQPTTCEIELVVGILTYRGKFIPKDSAFLILTTPGQQPARH